MDFESFLDTLGEQHTVSFIVDASAWAILLPSRVTSPPPPRSGHAANRFGHGSLAFQDTDEQRHARRMLLQFRTHVLFATLLIDRLA